MSSVLKNVLNNRVGALRANFAVACIFVKKKIAPMARFFFSRGGTKKVPPWLKKDFTKIFRTYLSLLLLVPLLLLSCSHLLLLFLLCSSSSSQFLLSFAPISSLLSLSLSLSFFLALKRHPASNSNKADSHKSRTHLNDDILE